MCIRDSNVADGYRKYSVLSHVEVTGGKLVGTDVFWAAPANGVPNSLPDKFDPWTYAYTINVPAGTTSLSLKPVPLSTKVSSVKVNGAAVTPGAAATVAVSAGSTVKVDVVSPDGSTTSTYTFTIAVV